MSKVNESVTSSKIIIATSRQKCIFASLELHQVITITGTIHKSNSLPFSTGPCDGIGAVAKRKADKKVQMGHDLYSAADFVDHCNDTAEVSDMDNSLLVKSKISYALIPLEDSWAARSKLPFLVSPNSVDKSNMIHSAMALDKSETLITRFSSCYRACCWDKDTLRPIIGGQCTNTRMPAVSTQWSKHELFNPGVMEELAQNEQNWQKAMAEAREAAEKEEREKEQRRQAALVAKQAELKRKEAAKKRKEATAKMRKQATANRKGKRGKKRTNTDNDDQPAPEGVPMEQQPEGQAFASEDVDVEREQSQKSDDIHAGTDTRRFYVGEQVAAVFGNTWYIATVKEVLTTHTADLEYDLDYLWHTPTVHTPTKVPKFFKPPYVDRYDTASVDILCRVSGLKPVTGSRGDKYSEIAVPEELNLVRNLYSVYPDGHVQLAPR